MADTIIAPRYGRLLEDFTVGETYQHPWEVTLDAGLLAFVAASFQDATPLWSSKAMAESLGFRDRPVAPLALLNLALSFSVHDVSEQAIAHLAYLDVRFPEAAHVGDTVSARSTVLGAKPASSGDKGVVHVRTVLETHDGRVVCAFERKALVRAGKLASRPSPSTKDARPVSEAPALAQLERLPAPLRGAPKGEAPSVTRGLPGAFEDFAVGQTFAHAIGRTVGESEHMQLTTLFRNSHPLHFDELYAREYGFKKGAASDGNSRSARVVYGGLVFGWVLALTSRDVAGHALWELGFDEGAHPSGVLAGDTLYAASRVLAVEDRGPAVGAVTFKLVGVANVTAEQAVATHGDRLFESELGKKSPDAKVKEKVFEIRRTLLVRKRGA